uniref:Putative iron-sulfur cluster-binding domain contining protein n=1 Tax=viral metagenome TaxID=1070528 RepID=A0A6M3IIK6_9ZZZZ
MNGLAVVNLELTSRCNKACFCCGRRKLEKEHPELCNWGDMDLGIALDLSLQIPNNTIVQFHNNGEPLLYPDLGGVLCNYDGKIRCFNTNGKLLLEKAKHIIDNMETLTISVIENDPEGDEQYEIVKKFLEIKGNKPPFMIYRLLGNITKIETSEGILADSNRKERWYALPGIVATRILHNPMGSFDYTKKVTIPEIGVCLDLLNHLVINREGDVFPCVRFNPGKKNLLGNIKNKTLKEMWNGDIRHYLIDEHIKGNRNCSELCSACHFYGCPTGS